MATVGLAVIASVPAAVGQSSGWSISIGRSVQSGGVAWTGPDGAEVTWTRPSWAAQASDALLHGTRLGWSSGWFTPGGDVTRSWSNLAEGSYTVRVEIRTVVTCFGHTCGYGQERKTAGFRVDRTPPGAPQVAVPDGPVGSAEPVQWTPVDDAGAGLARYEVRVDGAVQADLGPGECASKCEATLPAGVLADGPHDIQVRAVDHVGNAAQSSAPPRLVRDIPRVEFVAPPVFVIRGRAVTLRAAASTDNGGAVSYAWDTDGDGDVDRHTGATPIVTITPDADATVTVRATAQGGGEATADLALDVRPAALADAPGVSIEDAARFTRTPRVKLSIAWPDGATGMRIATDGGFPGAEWRPVAPQAAITLEADPDARLPHVVYVRFRGRGIDARETYTDDIILDTTAPVVQAATAQRAPTGLRLTTRARDALSGLQSLQVTAGPGRPVTTVPYSARAMVRVKGPRPLVRVVDRAGNESGWVRARAKRGR